MGLASPAEHRAFVLLVDSTRAEREQYASYLTQNGISTVEAEDGFQGIAKAATQFPDVIAAALGTPAGDILSMCCWLKGQDATRHIPIVAISSVCKVDEVNRAMQAGCVSVLLKPCLPHDLFAEIQRVLALPKPAA